MVTYFNLECKYHSLDAPIQIELGVDFLQRSDIAFKIDGLFKKEDTFSTSAYTEKQSVQSWIPVSLAHKSIYSSPSNWENMKIAHTFGTC